MRYTRSYWAILALIRFALAFVVFDGHLHWVGLASVVGAFLPDGISRTAVLGFLLISGASIAASFRNQPQGFYTRRFLRIYPLYLAAVVFTLLVGLLVRPPIAFPRLTLPEPDGLMLSHAPGLTALANLLFLQGAFTIPLPYDGPVWSLAVEAWLYALTPLFFRMPRRWLLGLAAVSFFLFTFRDGTLLALRPVVGSVKWCWPWWIGFLAARDQKWLPTLLAGGAAVALFGFNHDTASGWQCGALFVLVLGAVLWAGKVQLGEQALKVFNFLGDISYPLYLFHLPVMILLYARFSVRSEIGFVALVVAVAVGLDVWYERRVKAAVWKPLTLALVRCLPSGWALLRTEAARKTTGPVSPEPALSALTPL